MPRQSTGAYPDNWREIATGVKEAAGWACVRCGAPHENRNGYRLTCHHLDLNPANCAWWNIPALCCACHLQIQHKVDLDRPWVMTEHSDWAKPYMAGFYAHKYLGRDVTREEVEADLEWFVGIERRHYGVEAA